LETPEESAGAFVFLDLNQRCALLACRKDPLPGLPPLRCPSRAHRLPRRHLGEAVGPPSVAKWAARHSLLQERQSALAEIAVEAGCSTIL